jgi:hypothetical protein
MAIGTLYIGSKSFDFQKLDTEWLTSKNLKKVLASSEINDYHTSIEDSGLLIESIEESLLSHCQSIECLDLSWNTVINLENYSRYMHLASLLRSKYKNKSTGWEELYRKSIAHVAYKRATKESNKPSLWVAGCSWSSAMGVETDERWGHLVAKELDLEEINLAIGGGSIWDASDQILRADIQKGDIVVWGLTSLGWVDVVNNNQLRSFAVRDALDIPQARDYYNLGYFWSNTQCLIAMRQIQQVINYCSKIGARLYLVNFLDIHLSSFILGGEENYLDLSRQMNADTLLTIMIDYGTDDKHPGPLQHQQYAKEIIKFIQQGE